MLTIELRPKYRAMLVKLADQDRRLIHDEAAHLLEQAIEYEAEQDRLEAQALDGPAEPETMQTLTRSGMSMAELSPESVPSILTGIPNPSPVREVTCLQREQLERTAYAQDWQRFATKQVEESERARALREQQPQEAESAALGVNDPDALCPFCVAHIESGKGCGSCGANADAITWNLQRSQRYTEVARKARQHER